MIKFTSYMENRMLRMMKLLSVVLVGFSLLSACAPGGRPVVTSSAEPIKLRFAVLRILEALPLFVAEQNGYFRENGLDVEIILVQSAPERDQLIAAGQADGIVNEVLSTMLANQNEPLVKTVRYARTATSQEPLFRILASQQSGITSVEGVKGVEVGISNATVIEYLNDRLLSAEGLLPNDIKTMAVPSLSDRLALLLSGELKVGVLPDPLASLAMLQGAVNILDDTSHPEFSYSAITFRQAYINENPAAVRGFLQAIEDAVSDINADSNSFLSLLSEKQIVPEPLMASFEVPPFVTAGVPTEAQYADVLAWAKETGLVQKELPYGDVITAEYLPK